MELSFSWGRGGGRVEFQETERLSSNPLHGVLTLSHPSEMKLDKSGVVLDYCENKSAIGGGQIVRKFTFYKKIVKVILDLVGLG